MFGRMGMMAKPSSAGIQFPPVTSGLTLFLDASVKSSIRNASGDIITNLENVAEWRDLSGNDYHVTQATVNKQPIYYDDSPDFNGAPAIVFDDVVNGTQLLNTTATNLMADGHTEFYGFTNGSAGGSAGTMVSGGSANGHIFGENGHPGGGGVDMFMFAGAVVNTGNYSFNFGSLATLVYNGANSYHRADQVEIGPANPGAGTANGISLGSLYTGAGPCDCEFGIVLIYNRVLTSQEILDVENWIYDNNKIGA